MAIWAMEIQVLEYKTSKTLANKSMISMETLVSFEMKWWQGVYIENLYFQCHIFEYFSQKQVLGWFFHKDSNQFSLLVVFIYVTFKKVYTVKMCPNFVGSSSFHFKESFKTLHSYSKIYWILYPLTHNSTTGIATKNVNKTHCSKIQMLNIV